MKKHPQLARKFELLYTLQFNPSLRSHADLAKSLNISRQSVSRWCVGTTTTTGNSIPRDQVNKVAAKFDISPNWFTLEYEDFEQRVRNRLESKEADQSGRKPQISISTMPITEFEIFGREKEFDLLDTCWQNPQVNVVQLIAFGGVGKSSLVNRWLSNLSKDNYRTAKRVYAWSFYWQGDSSDLKSSGDSFIEHALEWFGDDEPTRGSPWVKATRLAKLIRSSSTLLVLDGLEPMQTGPGPKVGQVENPAIALLIRELAADINGLCVITSRLEVSDLAPYRDKRVAKIDLENISLDAAVNLLNSRGVFGNEFLIKKAASKYIGHPLSLSLLGGYIRVVHQGDIRKFTDLNSLAEEQQESEHSRTLVKQYQDWFIGAPAQNVLYFLSMFDRTVLVDDIRELARKYEIAGLTEKLKNILGAQWSYALKQLESANLITVRSERGGVEVDCHPLVRDFVADDLKNEQRELWIKGNEAIFCEFSKAIIEKRFTSDELEIVYRAVIHGAQAERFEEAFELYFKHIKKGYTMLSEGSYYSDLACIKAFFTGDWTSPNDALSTNSKYHLISSASADLMSLGRIREAINPSLLSMEYFIGDGQWLEAMHMAGPLISALIESGELEKASSLILELQSLNTNTNNPVLDAMGVNFQAYIYFLSGEFGLAKVAFEKVEEILNMSDPEVPVNFPTVSSYYCKYLLETGDVYGSLERSLKTFGWRERKSWQVAVDTTSILASDLLVLGLTFLKIGDRVNAKKHLDKQVKLFKSADEWLYLPTGLNSRARLHIAMENFDEALQDLNESLEISIRTGARFGEWEAYIDMAQLYVAQEEYEKGSEYLERARALPNMEMYKFRDAEISELETNIAQRIAS